MRLPPIVKAFRNRRGSLIANVVAGVIILSTVLASTYLFSQIQKTDRQSAEFEAAGNAASKKLEELMNLAFNAGELSNGDHTDTAPDSPLQWKVTDVGPRLKKIEVISLRQHKVTRLIASSGQGVLVSGYRYDDF